MMGCLVGPVIIQPTGSPDRTLLGLPRGQSTGILNLQHGIVYGVDISWLRTGERIFGINFVFARHTFVSPT